MIKSRKEILKWLEKRKIAVLCGGFSPEKEISKKTGKAVFAALQQLGLNSFLLEANANLPLDLLRKKISFCFIALHGKWGEDGTVQGLLEIMQIPYTGSGVLASALSINKILSKQLFISHGIPTPPFHQIQDFHHTTGGSAEELWRTRFKIQDFPIVVKPVDCGSAIGVSIVREKSELKKALQLARRVSHEIFFEKFIAGKEITAPVLGEKVLPLIEIIPKSSFYDYKAKYVKGMSTHLIPASIPAKAARQIQELALGAHQCLGCRAFSRVDFILDAKGKPWVLEVNSIPGMTETSLFPEAAQAAGISFPEMVLDIIRYSIPYQYFLTGRPQLKLGMTIRSAHLPLVAETGGYLRRCRTVKSKK